MKAALLLTLLVLVSGSAPPMAKVVLAPLTRAAYGQAQQNRVVTRPAVTFPVKKQRHRLVIPTAAGPKTFTDVVTDGADMETYTYRGYYPDLKCHLVEVQYWETTQWVLVSAAGKEVGLWGAPVFAPDKQHLAASCRGIAATFGQPNLIQLLELRNGALRQVWSLEPKTWEPKELFWTGSLTLCLRKEMWIGKKPGTTSQYSKLTIQ